MSRLSSKAGLANEVADYAERVVVLTAGAQTLVRETHADRLLVVNSELTDAAQTKTLPKSIGSGDKY